MQLQPGDPQNPDPDHRQRRVADTVDLLLGARLVSVPAVVLHHQTVIGPHEVAFVAVEVHVHAGARQVAPADQASQDPLAAGAQEGGWLGLAEHLAQQWRPRCRRVAAHQLDHRPVVVEAPFDRDLELIRQVIEPRGGRLVEDGALDAGDGHPLVDGTIGL